MIVKDAAWIAAGQAIVVIAGLAGTRVLTTLLPPEVYGQISLVVGLGTLGTGLFCLPFLQAAMRSFPDARLAGKVGALRRLAASYVQRGVLAAGLLLALAGAGWTLWSEAPVPTVVFLVAAGVVAADAWRSFEAALLNGARRQQDYATRTALDALARPTAAALLVWWLGPSALYVLLGFVVGSVTLSLLLRRRTVRGADELSVPDDPWVQNHRGEFLRYALPLMPMAAMNWVMSMGDRYFLNASWGPETVGIYWAAYALGSQPFIAANALLHNTLRPVLYEAVAQGDAAKERRTLRVLLGLALAVGVTGWLLMTVLAAPLCTLLLGSAYRAGAAALLPWIGAAYALQMVQQAFEVILYAHRQSRQLVVLQAIAAASAVVLFLWLIPDLAGQGAALGTLGSVVITTAVAIWLSGAPRKLFGS